MLQLNDLMAVCVHNLPLVILLMLSPLRNEIENENKIHVYQKSSVNIKSYMYFLYDNQNMFKRLGFLIFFTKIYKVCNDICNIYVLQDSCNLDVNRGVGV